MSMHFDGLFDCSKGNFKTFTEDSSWVTGCSILYLKEKNRIDVKGEGERGSALSISLTL